MLVKVPDPLHAQTRTRLNANWLSTQTISGGPFVSEPLWKRAKLHTQHNQKWAYSVESSPLLTFMDTNAARCRPSTGPLTDTNPWRSRLADLQCRGYFNAANSLQCSAGGHNHWAVTDWVRWPTVSASCAVRNQIFLLTGFASLGLPSTSTWRGNHLSRSMLIGPMGILLKQC